MRRVNVGGWREDRDGPMQVVPGSVGKEKVHFEAPPAVRIPAEMERFLDWIEGKLTSSKWAKIAKCSQDTAYRDILDLVERGVLQKDPGGGRSTNYSLAVIPQ